MTTPISWPKALPPSRFSLLPLLALAVLLASCNLRENSLLPPDLDPLEYVTSNTVKVYKDHLIRSDNDDAYLHIPKESIKDSGIWYNDVVRLKRVGSLLERDSLAFARGVEPVTNCYRVEIERYGTQIILDSLPDFATLYADLHTDGALADTWLVRRQYLLDADIEPLYPYAGNRVWFGLDGNGDFELQQPGTATQFTIRDRGAAVEALYYSAAEKLQIWIPEAYLDAVRELNLDIQSQLGEGDLSAIQNVYPGFALNTRVLAVAAQSEPGGAEAPILHWTQPPTTKFVPQWVRLASNRLSAWPQSEETWVVSDGMLVSFLQGSGKYFLLSPLEQQAELDLPLDGSLTQLYLQDLWLDLRDTVISGHSLRLKPDHAPTQAINDYFDGSPFSLNGGYQAFDLEFRSGTTIIESLPGDNWIEFGFRDKLANSDNARLTRVYRSAQSDHLDFKTRGSAYDAGHFSVTDGYVYSGVNSSGAYILANVSEPGQQQSFPFLKGEVSIQTSRGYVVWNDPSGSFGSLSLEYGAAMPTGHPWLSGQPYTFAAQNSLFRVGAWDRSRNRSTELPANTFIVYKHSAPLANVVNFSPDPDYPRFVWYRAAADYAHNTFVYRDGALRISPAWPGYVFSAGSQAPAEAAQLRLYRRMAFDNYNWEYYSDAKLPASGTPILEIAKQNQLPDSHGVLAEQYQLSQLAPAYALTVTGSGDFFSTQLPYLRIRQELRSQHLLFSIYEGDFYRIYPYFQAAGDDPWHFSYEDGHAGFYLSSNAVYAPVTDLAPHQSVSVAMSSPAQDRIVSLYQAQLNLPAELIGGAVPLNSRIVLSEAVDFTAPVPHLSAYFVDFRTAAGAQYDPGFYSLISAPRLPYAYIPIPDYVPGQSHSLFFRGMEGQLTEFSFVSEFSDTPTGEYILVGNCAVAFVDGPGWFYTTD